MSSSSTTKLIELIKDYSIDDLKSMFALLQEDHKGDVRPFSEDQLERMNKVLPFAECQFSEKIITDVLKGLKQTKSKMAKIGRTQMSKFVLSLTRDEIVEVVQLLASLVSVVYYSQKLQKRVGYKTSSTHF